MGDILPFHVVTLGNGREVGCEEDSNDALDLDLPEGPPDTVGGLILQMLGRTARKGDVVRLDGVMLRVETLSGFAVRRIRLTRQDPA